MGEKWLAQSHMVCQGDRGISQAAQGQPRSFDWQMRCYGLGTVLLTLTSVHK